MPLEALDVQALRRWVITARVVLSEHADAINALNVFPVPDRDTGTNMSVTMELAVDGLASEAPPDLLTSVRVLARSTVLSARGNSGVILSQLVRGLADVVIALDGAPLRAPDVADVLREAARRARGGVRAPVEGTMLSVADAAAAAADGARDLPLVELVDAVVAAAEDAVGRTREQLPVLREAGVVDAGGVGYWLVLRSLQHVVRRAPGTVLGGGTPDWLALPERPCPAGDSGRHGGDGPEYELVFVVHDTDDERIDRLAGVLKGLGDSVVVAGGPDVWSVHAHLDDLGAGLNAAAAAGRPARFQVTRFADQLEDVRTPRQIASPVVAVLASPGLADLVHDADPGAQVLIAPDEGALGDALAGIGDRLLLTDTPALRSLAERAISGSPGSSVCHCQHPAQVLAALAVRAGQDDPAALRRDCDDAADAVTTHTLDGSEGAGDDIPARCRALLDRTVDDDVELVTLIAGADAPDGLLDALTEHLTAARPELEVTSFAGRRPGVVLDVGCE
ncbi:DAK2 domain-containing protein [Allobranchiibius sp. GilTou38]|uniref:DAK2 domain-containing protein n=1 Tax=Allobranchiibius sp. GilTou38 TaxID=2815210 RepID=UPI001AA1C412|nr:DAK2 domain-containing protein [Allobranchiibius sp. GilTou38]MBO1765598.1 DAK2 domain-containing protein [Allobranchiibius sp. GilTou38]